MIPTVENNDTNDQMPRFRFVFNLTWCKEVAVFKSMHDEGDSGQHRSIAGFV
jgi:hypothetical protein